jgi:hypothetical protein
MTNAMTRSLALVLASGAWLLAACGPTEKESSVPASAPAADAPAVPPVARAAAFDSTFELLEVRFHVVGAADGSVGRLTITPSGLEIDNSPMTQEIDGTVTGAEVADLNVDQSPEIYVYVRSAGPDARGRVVAYAANRRKSLSQVYLPPVTENAKAANGYKGHDDFAVVENTFVQRFPVYTDTAANATSTKGTRQLQYKLKPGEAGWMLKLDKVVDY